MARLILEHCISYVNIKECSHFQQVMPLNANGEVVTGVLPAGSYFRFMAKRIGGNSASYIQILLQQNMAM